MQARREKVLTDLTSERNVGVSGASPGNFKGPKGLAVDPHTQNIYVADMLNSRVQVFSPSLQFLFLFPNEPGAELSYPWGICIQDYLVFVMESASIYFLDRAKHGFSIYTFDGTLVSRVLRNVLKYKEQKLNIPRGIVLDVERNAFIADYQNNRVVLYCTGLPSVALVIGNIKHPVDVKIHEESLFVLSETGLLLELGMRSYETLIKIEKSDVIRRPRFFQVEKERIYISDSSSDKIYELSLEGHITSDTSEHNFINVAGIALDGSQIVVICERNFGRLIILS